MRRCFDQAASVAGDNRLARFDAYSVYRNDDPSGSFDRQKPSGLIMAEPKLAVRQHINPGLICDHIQGAEQGWLPKTNATACPVTFSTNAASEEASCAANGLRHEPRIIEAGLEFQEQSWRTPSD